MTSRIIAALAFSLALGTGAMAQQATDGAQPALPPMWEGPIGDAFYSDPGQGTLRSQDEIRTNWSTLTVEQQEQVRGDCQTITQSDSATDDVQTGSIGADGGSNFATVPGGPELCGWIADM